ncbi:MAG: CBS domain-containing protein [Methylococcales bacterium]|jgi:CBS domain-containing protein|nr:CBS domain-containing protein [Methylococcales bacterium]MBT7408706.1 CBS domain-containing protein [Methylococcales bacterium]
MNLKNILIPSGVARPGMLIKDAFSLCVKHNVPGLPYIDAQGKLAGRVSIRHIFKVNCIPDFMVDHAHLLGDSLGCINISKEHALTVTDLPVDNFVINNVVTITPASPVVKALAVMEKSDVTYIFVMENEQFLGTVTIMGVAKLMLEMKDQK